MGIFVNPHLQFYLLLLYFCQYYLITKKYTLFTFYIMCINYFTFMESCCPGVPEFNPQFNPNCVQYYLPGFHYLPGFQN
jgi:hypothetical protein